MLYPLPLSSTSLVGTNPDPWRAELVTTGELITSLGGLFSEATSGVQGTCELVLSPPLVPSVAFPEQTSAEHCFFEREWASVAVSPEDYAGQRRQGSQRS